MPLLLAAFSLQNAHSVHQGVSVYQWPHSNIPLCDFHDALLILDDFSVGITSVKVPAGRT